MRVFGDTGQSRHRPAGLDVARTALRRGLPVVLANKGPLALAYPELAGLSDLGNPGGSCAPVQHLRRRCHADHQSRPAGSRHRVLKVEAVLNGTTQFILRGMEAAELDEVLAEPQRRASPTDPSLDVDGWDAAAKLVIVSNAVLRQAATIRDVEVEGIRGLTPAGLAARAARGERVVLLCLAEPDSGGGGLRLQVRPTPLPLARPWPGWTRRRWASFTTPTSPADERHQPGARPGSLPQRRCCETCWRLPAPPTGRPWSPQSAGPSRLDGPANPSRVLERS